MNQHDDDSTHPSGTPTAGALSQRPTRTRYWVLAALCLAALVAYVQRNSIGVAEPEIRSQLHLNKYEMGWVISGFFLTYAAFQLPTGYLAKRLGTRRALPIFALLFSAAAGVFALARGFWTLIATRLAMGALQSGIFPCAVQTVQKWMPDSRRSFATGMLGSFMSLGGAIGVSLTGLLLAGFAIAFVGLNVAPLSWRTIFGFYCIPGLLFAVFFYVWFRDRPEQDSSTNLAERELIRAGESATATDDKQSNSDDASSQSEAQEPTPWGTILTSVPVWALCGQQVMRAAGYMFFASWFATYLRETRPEVGDLEAGILNSLPLLAVVFGSPAGGSFADWVLARTGSRRLSRQGVAAAAMLACCVLILIAYPIANPWLAVLLISAGSFCAAFGGPCAYTTTIDMGGKHVTMVFSLMNMAGNFGAFVFPIIVPWLLSENELYIDRIQLRPAAATVTDASGEIVIQAEKFTRAENEKINKVGRDEQEAVRFHHSVSRPSGTSNRMRIAAEYEFELSAAGRYEISLGYTSEDAPPLRLYLNGQRIADDAVGGRSTREIQLLAIGTFDFRQGTNVLRLETETEASGNWNLVLFLFAAMYIAAAACWLLADPTKRVDGSDAPVATTKS